MPNPQELQNRARQAAVDFANSQSVGDLVSVIDEGDNVSTFLFDSKLKGYVGWNFSVTIFSAGADTSISEVNLMPGEGSLLAPNWVPWSERLADYKALQAELEAQAAAEAAEAAENADLAEEDISADENSAETNSLEEVTEETSESTSAVLVEKGVDAEENADDTGKRPPRFLRRRLGRLKYKKDKS